MTGHWHCDTMGDRVWDRESDSPSDDKIFTLSTQQLQFNPTKSSRLGFRRSIAAIADLARSRGATVSSRASQQRHRARGRADHVFMCRGRALTADVTLMDIVVWNDSNACGCGLCLRCRNVCKQSVCPSAIDTVKTMKYFILKRT